MTSLNETKADQPIAAFSVDRKVEGPWSTEKTSGPQLLRRSPSPDNPSASNRDATKHQAVVLVDTDASGQISKTGDRDRKQALQQSVTAAAGIYKRLGTIDRH